MTPLDIVLYGCAFLVASIPVAVGIGIIGSTIIALRNKANEHVDSR